MKRIKKYQLFVLLAIAIVCMTKNDGKCSLYDENEMVNSICVQNNIIAKYYFEFGDYDKALAILKKTLEENDCNVESWFLALKMCVKLEKYDLAKYYLEKIRSYMRAKNINIIDEIKRDVEIAKKYGMFMYYMAKIMYENKEYQKAYYSILNQQKLSPGFAEVYILYGEICIKQHLFENALGAFKKAIEIDPDCYGKCQQKISEAKRIQNELIKKGRYEKSNKK